MANGFTIREPIPADTAGIARVHVQGWREAYGAILPSRFYDDAALLQREEGWRDMLSQGLSDRAVRVAELEDGTVAGLAGAGPALDPEEAGRPSRQLYMLYVLADHYGTGMGQALLDAVLEREAVYLWVAAENPRAQAFYRKNHFERDGTTKSDPDLDGLSEHRMTRPKIPTRSFRLS